MTTEFWDKGAQKYDDDIINHGDDFRRSTQRLKDLVSSSDTVLDFACASGEYGLALAPHVKQIHGIDTSEGMISIARKKLEASDRDNVSFDALDIFDEAFDGKIYSFALALNIVHLVDDVGKTLKRLHELLSNDGLLVARTPCLRQSPWLTRILIGFAKRIGLVPKIYDFTYESLEVAITDAGFSILVSEVWDKKNATNWIVARNTK